MPAKPASLEELERICSSAGFEFDELHKAREGVYQGTLWASQLGDSSEVYVKIYSVEKRRSLREFVDIATDAGHPECSLIEDRFLCLVMGIAEGRPLSVLLPIVFFPGVWRFRKKKYEQVYFKLGEQLGRLHSHTRDESVPILSQKKRDKAIQRTEALGGHLPKVQIQTVQDLLRGADEYRCPEVLNYGDRSPHNIYFDGSRVTQIDFGGNRRSVVYEHTSVLVGLRLMHRRLPYASSADKVSLEEAYWNGYSQTGIQPKPDKEALAIRCIEEYLDLLQFYKKDVSSLNAKLTKWIDPPKIRAEIKRTIDDLDP